MWHVYKKIVGCEYRLYLGSVHYWAHIASFFFFKQKTAYGRRISDWSSDVCSSDLAANIADANGWTMGGVEWSTDSKWDIFKRILQAGGCVPTQTGGLIGCMVNTPRVSVATITGAHLLDNLSYAANKSRRDRFNTVIPRFRDEDSDWQIVSGAPISVPDYVTADGGRRTKEITYQLVTRLTGETGTIQRSEERRAGKECDRTCKSR